MVPLLKESAVPNATPTKKNKTLLSVIWRNQMKSVKAQQLSFNTYHPKPGERQQ